MIHLVTKNNNASVSLLKDLDFGSVSGVEIDRPESYEVLCWFRERYALCTVGGDSRVIRLKDRQLLKVNAFYDETACRPDIYVGSASNKPQQASRSYVKWSGRLAYDGIGFWPDVKSVPEGKFNTYQGLAIAPNGDVNARPFTSLVKHICRNAGPEAEAYLIGWMAHLVQRPWQKPSVAVWMQSEKEGTGKGTLFRLLSAILGDMAAQINGTGAAHGRFNSILSERLLVFCDEAEASKAVANKLKAIISEPKMTLERKGIDPIPTENYARLMFATNEIDRGLHVGGSSRRYLVIELPPPEIKPEGMQGFWVMFQAWLDAGGAAGALHYLLQFDLSNFNPFACPVTDALRDARLQSIDQGSADDFILHQLGRDNPFQRGNGISTPNKIPVSDVVEMYSEYVAESGRRASRQALASELGKAFKKYGVRRTGRRGRDAVYHINVEQLQAAMAEALGVDESRLFE